jgi:hypothetical protein
MNYDFKHVMECEMYGNPTTLNIFIENSTKFTLTVTLD